VKAAISLRFDEDIDETTMELEVVLKEYSMTFIFINLLLSMSLKPFFHTLANII
jgi:hypothetical protein